MLAQTRDPNRLDKVNIAATLRRSPILVNYTRSPSRESPF
jgi:hypothetical protein